MTQSVARAGLDELITYYDDATGERTGLTAAATGEWSAATAALLIQGCNLRPGDRAAVLLPPHWQSAAVLLGAWAAGLAVSFRGWSTAGLAPAGDPLDVTFVEQRRIGSWLDDVPAGGYQFAVRLTSATDTPRGYDDYEYAVRHFLGAPPPPHAGLPFGAKGLATVNGETFGEYGEMAAEIAHLNGIHRGDRVLIDTASSEEPLMWLLAPLSVGASIVLCANLDRSRLDERISTERVTRVLA
jgi:uncharacterized protein (TIGR03089 family)